MNIQMMMTAIVQQVKIIVLHVMQEFAQLSIHLLVADAHLLQ